MKITITRTQLEELGAYCDGVKALEEIFGRDGPWTTEWTRFRQIELLRTPLGRYLGWARNRGLIPFWDMTGACLSGAQLINAILTGVKFTNAVLIGTNFSGADLSGADLTGADLSGANLSNADLRGTYLTDAKLVGANLRRANFTGANLYCAKLNNVILHGADFAGAQICSCFRSSCEHTRDILASYGWTPESNGLAAPISATDE